MKKVSAIGLLLILYTSTCHAQSVYSKQNLEQVSQDDLNLYLIKAKKTKKIGTIMSIGGPIAFGSGILLSSYAWSGGTEAAWGAGLVLLMAGTSSTLIGLPLLITGNSRVNRIKKINNNANDGVMIDLIPCNFQNFQSQNHQYGISLRVRF